MNRLVFGPIQTVEGARVVHQLVSYGRQFFHHFGLVCRRIASFRDEADEVLLEVGNQSRGGHALLSRISEHHLGQDEGDREAQGEQPRSQLDFDFSSSFVFSAIHPPMLDRVRRGRQS